MHTWQKPVGRKSGPKHPEGKPKDPSRIGDYFRPICRPILKVQLGKVGLENFTRQPQKKPKRLKTETAQSAPSGKLPTRQISQGYETGYI